MRLLLDTHVLIWALEEPARLARSAVATIEDAANQVLFSAASIWEVAIKLGLGRTDFSKQPASLAAAARATGFLELPVHADAAALVATLPLHHRDPFDRLLVAQAIAGSLRFYTADRILSSYSDMVTLVG